MARFKDGILGAFFGSIGPVVGYLWKGKPVMRSRANSDKKKKRKSSPKQLAVQSRLKVMCPVLNDMTDYLRIGFELDGDANGYTANNGAKSYNLLNGLKGEYPNLEVNYEALLLTKGSLPIAQDAEVEVLDEGLKFIWNAAPVKGSRRSNAMLMAYFPETRNAIYRVNGAMRYEGADILTIDPFLKGKTVHAFLSFITNDHKGISNSLYLGDHQF